MKIRFANPFEADGFWFKGNLHAHSTASDGVRSPQALVNHYDENGYDFLSITDHGLMVDPRTLDAGRMLLLPGEEICVGKSLAGTHWHMVGVGIEGPIPLKDVDPEVPPQRAIDAIAGLGGISIIAHPYWSGLSHGDIINLEGYLGVEIYNTSCDIYRNLGYSSPHIDALLAAGRSPLIFATDDHHGTPEPMKPSDACGAWIMVRAKELEAEEILQAIRKGLFYASTGPVIREIKCEDGELRVKTSPVHSISFVSTPSLGAKFTSLEGNLTEHAYPGREKETYVRIEATDQMGRTAWSNPIFIE